MARLHLQPLGRLVLLPFFLTLSALAAAPEARSLMLYSAAPGFVAEAATAVAGLELLDAAGRPATVFGSGETLRIRVTDPAAADNQGDIGLVRVRATCGSTGDFEEPLLREQGGTSFVFEADLAVRIGGATINNLRLECPAAGPLHFSYLDVTGAATHSEAHLTEASITFIDGTGSPTSELLDGSRARVRVTAFGSNLQPNAFDTLTVTVSSLNTQDSEVAELRETAVSSGIFEGAVRISSRPTGEAQVDVAPGGPPLFGRDQVTASFGAATASAEILAGRLSLHDAGGHEVHAVLPDSTLVVRVEMPSYGDPHFPDYLLGELNTPAYGQTPLSLFETAVNSQIFSGQAMLGNFSLAPGQLVGAYLATPAVSLGRQVPVVGNLARFVGPAGETVESLAPNRSLTVELTRPKQLHDPWVQEQFEVNVRSERGSDLETLVLVETDNDYSSAIFRGSLPLRLGAASIGDGTLEAAGGFPFGDTVRVEPTDSQEILAAAGLRLPAIRLLDAAGRETSRLIRGQRYQIEVEDTAFDRYSGGAEVLPVELLTIYAEEGYPLSTAALQETGLASGIFRGGLMMAPSTECPYDVACIPDLVPGIQVIARHQLDGGAGQIEATAVVAVQTLELVDAQGRAVLEALEGAPIRIRLVDSSQEPGVLESRTVIVASRLGGDVENLVVWETAVGSGIFERNLATRFQPAGMAGIANDLELTVSADPFSDVATGEAILLHFAPSAGQPLDAAVPTVAARLSVLDQGQPATAVAGTYPLTLRLECPSLAEAGLAATFRIDSTAYGDFESFTVTNSQNGVYSLSVPFNFAETWHYIQGDRLVTVAYGGEVVFRYSLTNGHSGELRIQLPVHAALLRFVDLETGAPLATAPDLRPFKVQLLEFQNAPWAIETRSLSLSSLLAGDLEQLELIETGYNTAIFEATVEPRFTYSAPNLPGALEVSRRAGGIFDLVTATAVSGWGQPATAVLPLSGPRVEWTDAEGRPVAEISAGAIAHVLIDDPLANVDPAQADLFTSLVSEGPGGFENLLLTETGPDTGIFHGSLPVALGQGEQYNGVLEAWPGSLEYVRYWMGTLFGSIVKEIRIHGSQLTFVDAAGQATTTYLEGETVRLRLLDADPARSPTLADRVEVRLGSIPLGLDDEILELVETSGDSNVFEGSMATGPAPAIAGNGVLEIGRGAEFDSAIAIYDDTSVVVAFASANSLRLIDRLGREITWLGIDNQQLGVELTKPAGNDPEAVDTLPGAVLLEHLGEPFVYDAEQLTLVETGPATGVFRGFLPTGWNSGGPGDGRLYLDTNYGGTAKASYSDGADTLVASLSALYDQTPLTTDDYLQLAAGASTTVPVLDNDFDPEATPLLLGAAFGSAAVSAAVNPDGTLTLAAAPGAFGFEVVTYLVSDQAGSISEGRVYVHLQSAPVVTILGPADGTVFPAQGDAVLTASAVDAQDGDLSSQIEWTSEGHYFGTGSTLVFSTTFLQPGSLAITATAINSQGVTSSATVTLVIDGAPTLEVISPAANTYQLPEGPNTFTATVADGEEPDLGPQIQWSSTRQGLLGTGATLEVDLTQLGSHQITASVTDRAGNFTSVVRSVSVNGRPQVEISGPEEGARIHPDETIEVSAFATDPEGGLLTYQWTLDGAPMDGSEYLLPLPGLAAGHHTVGVLVRDEHGSESSDNVSFTVLSLPTVTISAPAGATVVVAGESLAFAGSATATDGTDLSASLQWTSHLQGGQIGYGASFATSSLEAGVHQIYAHVQDADGLEGSALVQVEVHYPPYMWYHHPQHGAIFEAGEPVTLEAYANDSEDGDLSAQIEWVSSLDGAIGQGSQLSVTLSAGVHQITASVEDSRGATESRTVTITLRSNSAPQVTLLAPVVGVQVATGESITFSAVADDEQSGDVSASLVWTSSITGALGTGPSFSLATLQVGSHLITATATDPEGLQGSLGFNLLVVTPVTQTFVSSGPQDGFVLESGEETGVGGLASTGQLRLGDNLADRQYRSFLSFDTSPLPDGALIRKVTVRAYRSGTTGVNPATTHGDLSVDVKNGFFGASAALENADFQAAATVTGTCLMIPAAAPAQWSVGVFDAAGQAAVNLTGTTQVRMQLALDDDDDATNDYLDHYGGESTVASTRPQLVVEYLP